MTAPARPAATRHTAKLKKAAPWAVVSSFIAAGASLLSSLIVARLLEPREFGMAAVAISVSALLNTLLFSAMGQAIVRTRSADTVSTDRALALLLMLGIGSMALCWIVGAWLSHFYAEPSLFLLVGVGGIDCLLISINTLPMAILARKLRTRTLAMRTLWFKSASIAATVALAVAGAEEWSLIIGIIAGDAAAGFLLWKSAARRPRFRSPNHETLELIRFGLWVSAEQGIGAITVRGFVLLFGHYHGLNALGLLNFAIRLVDEVGNLLTTAISNIALAYFGALERAGQSMASSFLRGTHAIMLIASPMLFGIAAIAPDIVPVVFGEKWTTAVPAVQILAIFWAIRMSRILAPSVLRALGTQRSLAYNSLIALFSTFIALYLSRHAIFIVGVSTYGMRVIATLPVGLNQIAKSAGASVKSQVGATMLPLLCAASMAAMIVALRHFPLVEWQPVFRLAVAIPAGVAIYLGLVVVFDWKEFMSLKRWWITR